jgi:hypothetical protein
MFFFRLNKVKIRDNGDGKFLGILGSDKSKIQFISLVVSESISLPDLGDIINENDGAKRKELLKEAVLGVASAITFTPIHGVKDNTDVTFGDTGVVIHKSDVMPKFFGWEFLVVKLNKDNRDLGEELNGVVNDEKFDGFAANFPKLIGKTAAAPYTAGVEIGKFIFNAFTKHLSKQKDKQLGILEMSFIKQLDYKNGSREGVGVQDESGNLRIDYSIITVED